MEAVILMATLFFAMMFGALSSKIARIKGHSGYGLWGVSLGPIGLIAVAALPDERQVKYLKVIAEKLEISQSNDTDGNF